MHYAYMVIRKKSRIIYCMYIKYSAIQKSRQLKDLF